MKAPKPARPDPAGPDDEHRVIPFRPRSPRAAGPTGQSKRPADSRATPPEPSPPPDDFRQRMLANLAAFMFAALLTAIGIWLATTIADLRKAQDCSLMGRPDCQKPLSKSD